MRKSTIKHSVKIVEILSFCNNFVKAMVLLENFSFFYTVSVSMDITEIYCHDFLAKISWKQRIY